MNLSLEQLKNQSIRVYTGMTVVSVWTSKETCISIDISMTDKCYTTDNTKIVYISNQEVFVTPHTRSAIHTLRSEGFHAKDLEISFDNDHYPKNERFKWKRLCEKAQQSSIADFVNDCEEYCDEHSIGIIQEETLKNCFEIPLSGVHVQSDMNDAFCYPAIIRMTLNRDVISRIGHFNTHNNIVVFVYRNGKTYVTKGYEIITELILAGYSANPTLLVPFSNSETILDPVSKKQWDSIVPKD